MNRLRLLQLMNMFIAGVLPHGILLRLLFPYHNRKEERAEAPIRKKLGLPLLTREAAIKTKRSDTVFILGSGPSINEISESRWKAIAAADTMGLNFWPFHRFVPDVYFFENRPCRPWSDTVADRAGSESAKLLARRANDYARVLKVVMNLAYPEPNVLTTLAPALKQNLFAARTVTPVARSLAELEGALRYVADRGMFEADGPYDGLLKYNGTITTLITLAVKLGYRNIVLCGVDLGRQQYFWQDPALYPESAALEFAPRNAPHHTATSNPWMVPMNNAIHALREVVLDPAGIRLYVENRSSALHPVVEEAPERLYDKLRGQTPATRGNGAGPSACVTERSRPAVSAFERWRRRNIVRKAPGQGEFDFLLGAAADSALDRVRRTLWREQWFLAVRPSTAPEAGFRVLLPDAGRFYVDPFLHRKGGRHFVFFEEMVFRSRKARIAAAEILEDGTFSPVTPVLEMPYHLSYPFVFDWQGETFMVPESVGNRSVELYRAREYPTVWEREKILLSDINAVDPTLLEWQGRWWMFTNVAAPGQYDCDYLHVYVADSPLGEWRPHPRNPVVYDRGGSRPAGGLFVKDGRLIRPAQDCSRVYGESIVLKQVNELTESTYSEVAAGRIEASLIPGARRVHTVNRDERWEVYDGFRWVWGRGKR